MAYRLKKKICCVKQALNNILTISEISKNRKVPRRTLYRWIKKYKQYGKKGLNELKRGRKHDPINPKFENFVYKLWHKFKYGSNKLWRTLNEMGFSVSQRKIQSIYKKCGLKMNRRKRPSQIKFVKYEWSKPNMLWHTDWTDCQFTNKKLIAFIDDHSRFIVHAEYFENATTENIPYCLFKMQLINIGIPENILTDNGTQFTPARSERGPFTKWCKEKGIKHILGRVHHPQTNGKIERWFGTYKIEFDERFSCLNDFVKFYNEVRIHQGINFIKPLDRYKSAINSF